METSSQLQSIDQLRAISVALEQPLVMLLESGPAFSVLVASRVSPEPDDGMVSFEDCLQIRIEADGRCASRSFFEVAITQDAELPYWIASPDGFRSLFSQPSWDPYAILQLSEDEAEILYGWVEENDFGALFDMLRIRFGRLPRFYTPDDTKFCAPENYAAGRVHFPHIECFL